MYKRSIKKVAKGTMLVSLSMFLFSCTKSGTIVNGGSGSLTINETVLTAYNFIDSSGMGGTGAGYLANTADPVTANQIPLIPDRRYGTSSYTIAGKTVSNSVNWAINPGSFTGGFTYTPKVIPNIYPETFETLRISNDYTVSVPQIQADSIIYTLNMSGGPSISLSALTSSTGIVFPKMYIKNMNPVAGSIAYLQIRALNYTGLYRNGINYRFISEEMYNSSKINVIP